MTSPWKLEISHSRSIYTKEISKHDGPDLASTPPPEPLVKHWPAHHCLSDNQLQPFFISASSAPIKRNWNSPWFLLDCSYSETFMNSTKLKRHDLSCGELRPLSFYQALSSRTISISSIKALPKPFSSKRAIKQTGLYCCLSPGPLEITFSSLQQSPPPRGSLGEERQVWSSFTLYFHLQSCVDSDSRTTLLSFC